MKLKKNSKKYKNFTNERALVKLMQTPIPKEPEKEKQMRLKAKGKE